MTDSGYEHAQVDAVEARVGVRAWGPTREEAFAQAALGVLALVTDPAAVVVRETREVRAQSGGPQTLLAAWVDECLYVHEIEAFVVSRVEVTACGDTVVHGRLHGEPLDPARHTVEPATRHETTIQAVNGRHEAKIMIGR